MELYPQTSIRSQLRIQDFYSINVLTNYSNHRNINIKDIEVRDPYDIDTRLVDQVIIGNHRATRGFKYSEDLIIVFSKLASETLKIETLEYIAHHVWCHIVSVDPKSRFCIYKNGIRNNSNINCVDTEVDRIYYNRYSDKSIILDALTDIADHIKFASFRSIFKFIGGDGISRSAYNEHIRRRMSEVYSDSVDMIAEITNHPSMDTILNGKVIDLESIDTGYDDGRPKSKRKRKRA